MADFILPPDFVWDDDEGMPKHRVSGKLGWITLAARPPNQGEIDYLCARLRREYRRDRLFLAVGRNIERFRECQAALRQRGFAF